MQRPVMNPSFFDEAPANGARRFRPFRLLARSAWRVVWLGFRCLTYDPFSRLPGFRNEDGTPTSRFVRGLMYRLAFVPVLIAATACGIVWTATHPRTVVAQLDPASQGIYYEAVNFAGADQVRLEGWLVPTLDAKTVLAEHEKVLRARYPAVVLVHDLGQRREQVLPLIKPLHDAGLVVLAINLRGGGPHALTGETFGLTEAGDVRAAVQWLGRRPFVDPARIAVVGFGTGATASLLAADADHSIAAVVAYQPVCGAHEIVDNHIMPRHAALGWLAPICKWTFQISYGVDPDETSLVNFQDVIDSRHVLLSNSSAADPSNPKTIEQTRSYLAAVFPGKDAVAGAGKD